MDTKQDISEQKQPDQSSAANPPPAPESTSSSTIPPNPTENDDLFTVIIETHTGARIPLESIHIQNTVMEIKGLLNERAAVSHVTCYHLELIKGGPQPPSSSSTSLNTTANTSNKKNKKNKRKESFPLNDYAELSMAPELVTKFSVLRMVLDNYDVRQARLHIRRLREILTTSRRPLLPAFCREAKKNKNRLAAERAASIEKTQSNNSAEVSKSEKKTPESLLEAQEKAKQILHEERERATALGMSMPSIKGAVSNNIGLGDFYSPAGGCHQDETMFSTVPGWNEQNTDNLDNNNSSNNSNSNNNSGGASKKKQRQNNSSNNNNNTQCDVSILFSGWNPPPPNRHMMGDLVYLIIETPTSLNHVTACPLGFFINATSHETFNPDPPLLSNSFSNKKHQSSQPLQSQQSQQHSQHIVHHDLLDLIKKINPSFEKMYQQTVRHNQTIEQFASPSSTDMSDVWDALLSVPGTPTGPSTQWNIRIANPMLSSTPTNTESKSNGSNKGNHNRNGKTKSKKSNKSNQQHQNSNHSSNHSNNSNKTQNLHKYDLNRAENDLMDTFGMDERGALRDWNEDYQQSKELPASTVQERLIRARTLHKNQQDFLDAAQAGAKAIVNGHVLSINPMDVPDARVYVFNNIFFSLSIPGAGRDAAHDGTESHEFTGDVKTDDSSASGSTSTLNASSDEPVVVTSIAASKHDLHGTLAMNRADVAGLHTLATAVLDYMGQRVVAQSIIPGILQGEHNSKLVYGSVDGGITIASDPIMHSLMQRAAKYLLVGERIVTPLGYKGPGHDAQEATPVEIDPRALKTCADIQPVPLCGPVDCKGMEGCDGRHYVLDLVHMMPCDYNFQTQENLNLIGEPQQHTTKKSRQQSSSAKRAPKGCRESLCLLRPELIRQYANFKVSRAKEKVIQTHRQNLLKEKQLKEEEEAKKKTAEEGNGDVDKSDAAKSDAAKSDATATAKKENEPSVSDLLTKAMIPPLINPNVFGKHQYTINASNDASNDATNDPADSTNSTTSLNIQEKDEQMSKDLALYLKDRVIPIFLHEIKLSNTQLVDGAALVATMHQRGINVRYLGHMACKWVEGYNVGRENRRKALQHFMDQQSATSNENKNALEDAPTSKMSDSTSTTTSTTKVIMSEEDDVRRSYFLRLVEIEMIARVVRHSISTLLRENKKVVVAPAAILAKYLSKMMTRKGGQGYDITKEEPSTTEVQSQSQASGQASGVRAPASEYALRQSSKLLPTDACTMWKNIKKDVYSKFRYNLNVWPGKYEQNGKGIVMDIDRIALLRRICQLVGITLRSREFNFSENVPIVSADIYDMKPICKDGFTKCQMKDIVELIEYGRARLNQRQLNEAHVALQESLGK